MEIKSARFVVSNSHVRACPETDKKEFAFIGRSNVGKSTLINMLTGESKLAKTSSTPGKTQLINHFEINDTWWIADLPGYGYAKVSKTQREKFGDMISSYLLKRENLITTFVLIDCRLEPQKIDLEFMNWCGEKGISFSIIFTKIDKLSPSELRRNLLKYEKELLKYWEEIPPVFKTSSTSHLGKETVLDYIESLL